MKSYQFFRIAAGVSFTPGWILLVGISKVHTPAFKAMLPEVFRGE
jgi:hypothetical protein